MWEWPLLRGKEKIWWSGLSCWSSEGGGKVTRQKPDQWLRQWDKHLLGHCAGNGGLDLTLLFPHCEQGWEVWERTRGAKHLQWPVGVELWFPSLAHVITANWHKGGSTEEHLPISRFLTLFPHMLQIIYTFPVWFLKALWNWTYLWLKCSLFLSAFFMKSKWHRRVTYNQRWVEWLLNIIQRSNEPLVIENHVPLIKHSPSMNCSVVLVSFLQ